MADEISTSWNFVACDSDFLLEGLRKGANHSKILMLADSDHIFISK